MLDEGVLNMSLILRETENSIDINRGYDAMWNLIQRMLKDYNATIEAKEIIGSYCPGSYDLSIQSKKSLLAFHSVVPVGGHCCTNLLMCNRKRCGPRCSNS
ncbi:hypothetical protein GCM10020331_013050 [Ectobacillus funiculus]